MLRLCPFVKSLLHGYANCTGAETAGKYTIVGQVIDGMDVLDKMEKIKVGKLRTVFTAVLCL